ncbi:helix-turn-helix transcriptional regulator [Desulfovibrio sp. JC010]|uniref:helix-turn-helix domain-containing protein n=1 Tax=Desulfovibrio sp. JC010 TaxID=2593641 RepID=UPI0013D0CC26|nr:helix-turn-helix transcriptional regulator [Desulfovibrio sp. JC010]NDV27634.1 helix-turn-helix transcriptional regulator [Desulfovibrio sp. JC010]
MPDRIFRVIAIEKGEVPYTLFVTWEDNVQALVDVHEYIDRYQTYACLRDSGWNEYDPQVGEYGGTVDWIADEVDMTSDTLRMLWMFQTEQAMHPKDFAAWMEGHGFSLDSAAKALGISRRMVAYYKSGERTIPRYILLACRGYDVRPVAA